MPDDAPPLLTLLRATADDPELFYLDPGFPDPEEFRAELRAAWAALYANAAWCWNDMADPEFAGEPPEIFGPEMCARFKPLSTCWLEDFARVARLVADRENLPEPGRPFLYFMLGVLWLSWNAHLREKHGRSKLAAPPHRGVG